MRWQFVLISFCILYFQACAEGAGVEIPLSDNNTQTPIDPNNGKGDVITNCVAGTTICDGETGTKTCKADGSGYIMNSCLTPNICRSGVCQAPPFCSPGEKRCENPSNVATCSVAGDAWTSSTCPSGEGCVKGFCVAGTIDGADCADNSVCASKTCHCGAEEDCALGQTGICVSPGCEQGCGTGFCFSGQTPIAGRTTSYDFCMQACEGVCDSANQKCLEVPSTEGLKAGCYLGRLKSIGEDCTTATSCIGGICRTDYFRESNLCTRNCDATTPCPMGSACVDLDGIFQCTLICGDGSSLGVEPCPLDLPSDRFDVTCKTVPTAGGTAVRACVNT